MRSILMAVSLVAASVASADTLDRLAAVVGDEPIALSEVYELGGDFIEESCPSMRPSCVREVELDILDSLILRVLIRQELASLGQDVTAEELRRTLDDVARDNGMENQAALRSAVEESGERWDVYRDEIREQLRQGRFQNWIIAPRIPVSEDERLDAYRRMTRDVSGPGKVKFEALTRPIDPEGGPEALPDAVMAARLVWEQLQSGEMTWEQALADYHSGAVTGPTGDRIPAVSPGGMVGALDTAVFSTDVGEIAEPVVASGHVFIVRVQEKMDADVRPYEEVRDALDQQIKALKGELEIEQWYQQARREAAVRILLEPL